MLEPPARLWLNQARSDLAAAGRVLDRDESGTFCQAIAKFQQVVEKSVKSMAAAGNQAGISTIRIRYSHDLERIVSGLVMVSGGKKRSDITGRTKSLLNESCRGEINALISLAPKQPAPGGMALRNTEYPFQKPDGTWIAPHEDGVFSLADVDRFRSLAHRILDGSAKIVAALERRP